MMLAYCTVRLISPKALDQNVMKGGHFPNKLKFPV